MTSAEVFFHGMTEEVASKDNRKVGLPENKVRCSKTTTSVRTGAKTGKRSKNHEKKEQKGRWILEKEVGRNEISANQTKKVQHCELLG